MFSIESRVGRLVEVRVLTLDTEAEVGQVGTRFAEVVGKLPGKVIVCGDYRTVRLFSPAVADRFMAVMAGSNPRVERSAVLLPARGATSSGLSSLQISRIVRETRFPSRRTFREAGLLESWLSEVLDETERVRLREFLAEASN